ncbi:hypothetical protein CISEMA079M_01330 [Citrobacter sedlakii]
MLPSVRVMYQWTHCFSPLQCLPQRLYHIFCMQIFSNMVAHDFSEEGIRNQTQIDRATAQWKGGNIGNPDLLRFKGGYLLRTGFLHNGYSGGRTLREDFRVIFL